MPRAKPTPATTTTGQSYTFEIPGHPARLNQLLAGRWQASRLKARDRRTVALAARLAGIPPATGKRRVELAITLGPRQRGGDKDAYWKSTLDALVRAGLLTDDNRQGVELAPVAYDRGPAPRSTITLTDLE